MRIPTRLGTARRKVAAAAARAARSRSEAALRRRRAGALFHDRLASPETLVFSFVGGLTTAMLAPQGRRDDPPERRRPASRNRALKSGMRLVRALALRQVAGALTD